MNDMMTTREKVRIAAQVATVVAVFVSTITVLMLPVISAL